MGIAATSQTSRAKHWANNFAGIFMLAVVLFVIVIAVSRQYPSAATSAVLWLLGILGVGSLAAWTWLSHRLAGNGSGNPLFRIR